MHPRIVLVVLAALLLGGTVGQRLFSARDEDRQAEEQARLLVLRQFRNEVEREAQTHAQTFVRTQLLPESVAESARIQELTLTHLKPHRYRVRGVVEWTSATGEPVRRPVEADLQHGPMDKNWYLLDTEFLTAIR